jgi:uncharacterized protein DUF4038/collagenase-like protein with putative collagen-binding domain
MLCLRPLRRRTPAWVAILLSLWAAATCSAKKSGGTGGGGAGGAGGVSPATGGAGGTGTGGASAATGGGSGAAGSASGGAGIAGTSGAGGSSRGGAGGAGRGGTGGGGGGVGGSTAGRGGSSSGGSGSGTSGTGGSPVPAGLFPLRVSTDRGSLVAGNGTPFLLHAEAAWSLIVQLTTADAMRYLTDRHSRGVNGVLVNLIEHKYATSPPRNAAGDVPFTTAGDFATPNEAYFAHADQVIDFAASQGIAVLLTPSYLGYNGGDEGWFVEMSASSAAKCRGYGDFVGRRYASRTNIIWVWGGDYTPPSGSAGETCMMNVRDGIRAAAPNALATGHWAPESTSRSEPMFTSSIDLVGVYTYQQILPACRAARTDTRFPRMPTYLFETCYEHETIQGCAATTAEVRRRQWWGVLGCGAGEIVGNSPIWRFGTGWAAELGSPVAVAEGRLAQLVQQVAWQTLELDDALVTANRGTGYAEIVATRTADHRSALIYIPPNGAATITVDLSHLTAAATATWQDPTAVRSVAAGTALTGSRMFTTPGNNSGGDKDWVLVLSVP